jgi:hypothetical protein
MPVIAETNQILSNLVKVKDPVMFEAGYCTETLVVNEASETQYKIGDLVGVVTATDKGKLAASASVDGSEDIYGVVIQDKLVEAAIDTPVWVLVRGSVILADEALNSDQVTDYTLATIKETLLAKNPAIVVGEQY